MQRAANTPTTSTPCASNHTDADLPRCHSLWRQETTGPWVQQQKTCSRPWATTSSPPPPPVFEISTRNRFTPLCETECDAVIIGDSIVRHIRATLAEGKVHSLVSWCSCSRCFCADTRDPEGRRERRIVRGACGGERHQAAAVRDFNIHVDNTIDALGLAFTDLINSFGVKQNVTGLTHRFNHTLDLIISYGSYWYRYRTSKWWCYWPFSCIVHAAYYWY